MIILEEKSDKIPFCPHCDKRLETIFFSELRGMLGRRYVYFCAYCEKVLGISHRKGFWMG
jgi:hypothetical protein